MPAAKSTTIESIAYFRATRDISSHSLICSTVVYRAQRTRELLQQAIMELLDKKAYEAINVRDITERAKVGHTTFYQHFRSKDELYLSAHVESVTRLGWNITPETLLATETPDHLVEFIEQVAQRRAEYMAVRRSTVSRIFLRLMQEYAA